MYPVTYLGPASALPFPDAICLYYFYSPWGMILAVMSEKKVRSAFIPILILVIILLFATFLVMLVPLVECRRCGGHGQLIWLDDSPLPLDQSYSQEESVVLTPGSVLTAPCDTCNEDHKTTFFTNWTYDRETDKLSLTTEK